MTFVILVAVAGVAAKRGAAPKQCFMVTQSGCKFGYSRRSKYDERKKKLLLVGGVKRIIICFRSVK